MSPNYDISISLINTLSCNELKILSEFISDKLEQSKSEIDKNDAIVNKRMAEFEKNYRVRLTKTK